jgi:hypothetical protein
VHVFQVQHEIEKAQVANRTAQVHKIHVLLGYGLYEAVVGVFGKVPARVRLQFSEALIFDYLVQLVDVYLQISMIHFAHGIESLSNINILKIKQTRSITIELYIFFESAQFNSK